MLVGQAAAEEEEPGTYVANSCTASGRFKYPVPGCAIGKVGRGFRDSYALRSHFRYRHSRDTVVVAGARHPRCTACGMQVSIRVAGLARHEATATCRRLTAMKVQHAAATAGARALERRFTAYGSELRQVEVLNTSADPCRPTIMTCRRCATI